MRRLLGYENEEHEHEGGEDQRDADLPHRAAPGGNLLPLLLSQNLTYGLSAQNSNVLEQTFFQFLETHNLGRILAAPRLLANSGEKAQFLSGGEIPIVISQERKSKSGRKECGTRVTFVPTVVGMNETELREKTEVSQPD